VQICDKNLWQFCTLFMPKTQTTHICDKCGATSVKWTGKCFNCESWGTLKEHIIEKKEKKSEDLRRAVSTKIVSFSDVQGVDVKRISSGISEVDRVLGGGLVPGTLVLLAGEPGVGKSTLVAQLAGALNKEVLYVSGEESASQLKLRFDRLELNVGNLKYLGETDADMVAAAIDELSPALAIVDSIQTIHCDQVPSEAGSVNQIKVSLAKIADVAKSKDIPTIIIGHITKEGRIAGPKTLEHMVDVVIHLEGDKHSNCRILRSPKNRFGGADEIGIFDMKEKGLQEVKNPSELFLANRSSKPGSVVTCVVEGSRPILVEVQALTNRTNFGYPVRRVSGFDLSRLQVIIAVLHKRAGLYLQNTDVHLNIVGGLKIKEPGADLAVALAIASAHKNKPVDSQLVACGEIGLGGEIRSVVHIEKRLKEAEKLGFKNVLTSKEIKNISEAMEFLE